LSYNDRIQQQLTALGELPLPSSAAIAHSEKLNQHLQSMADDNHGQLDFDEFMQQLLYAPGLGYYSAGAKKIGASGDFITAPEISPLF